MCIIIAQPAGLEVTRLAMQNSWNRNRDGAGLMYASDGKIHIHKELKSFNKFYAYYKRLITNRPDVNVVVHYRIGTHGHKDKANCHPFVVDEKLAFCHNGIINIKMPDKCNHSDTVEFRNSILQQLPKNFLTSGPYKRLLRTFIGYSKLCFLDNTGNVTIIKESLGQWDEGIWYSNDTYEDYSVKYTRQQLKQQQNAWDKVYGTTSDIYSYYDAQGRFIGRNVGKTKKQKKADKKKAKALKAENVISYADNCHSVPNRVKQKSVGLLSNPAGMKQNVIGEKSEPLLFDNGWEETSDSTEKDVPACKTCSIALQYNVEIAKGECVDCLHRYGTDDKMDAVEEAQLVEEVLSAQEMEAENDKASAKPDKDIQEHHKEFVKNAKSKKKSRVCKDSHKP